jgi:hypothetical protein
MRAMAEKYPNAWKEYADFRARKGSPDFDDWPSWCWVPLHGAYAIISGGGDEKVPDTMLNDVSILGAVAAWRQTQGVYHIDVDLALELLEVPFSGEIPSEVLFCLPEWCVYVELSEEVSFFAHLDWDVSEQHAELRVVLLRSDRKPMPIVAHIYSKSTIEEMVIGTEREIEKLGLMVDAVRNLRDHIICTLRTIIPVLLYLCSDKPDIIDRAGKRRKPGPPPPVSTATGHKFFPPANPTQWDVGYKVGAVLRSHKAAESIRGEGTHASPKPHVRRAHWHSYWTGPRDDLEKRSIVLKWIHPLLVGGDKIIPTVYQVKKDP